MYHMHTIVWMMWFSYSLVAVIIIIKVVIFFLYNDKNQCLEIEYDFKIYEKQLCNLSIYSLLKLDQ